MPRKVNVGGTWRTLQQLFVNQNGTWRRIHRVYVNQNGTWRFAYGRTPGAPQNVSLTVNGSSTSPQTTTSSPASAQVTWTVPSAETNLPAGVRWYVNSTQVGSEENVTTGTTASTTIALNSGDSKNIYAVVRFRNGPPGSITSNDVYGSGAGSNDISVTWPNPTVTNVTLTPNYAGDYLTVSWTATNAPSGATYAVAFYDDYDYPTEQAGGGTTATSFTLYLGAGYYGYDLEEFAGDNTLVNFTVTVYMKNSSNTIIAQGSAQGSFLVAY